MGATCTPVRRSRTENGFTLIELLVTVVVLAAVAGIAVPIFLNQKAKADTAIVHNNITEAARIISVGFTLDTIAFTSPLQGPAIIDAGPGTATIALPEGYIAYFNAETATYCVSGVQGDSGVWHVRSPGPTGPQQGLCPPESVDPNTGLGAGTDSTQQAAALRPGDELYYDLLNAEMQARAKAALPQKAGQVIPAGQRATNPYSGLTHDITVGTWTEQRNKFCFLGTDTTGTWHRRGHHQQSLDQTRLMRGPCPSDW